MNILNTRNIRGISDYVDSCNLETYSDSGYVQIIEKILQYLKGIIGICFSRLFVSLRKTNNLILSQVFFSNKDKSDFALR